MNANKVPKNLTESNRYMRVEKALNQEFASYCRRLRRVYFMLVLTEVLLLIWWAFLVISLRLVLFAVVLLISIGLHIKLSRQMRVDDNVIQSIGASRMVSYKVGGLEAARNLPPIRKFVLMSQYPPLIVWKLYAIVGILVLAFLTSIATLLALLISLYELPFIVSFVVHRLFLCLLHYKFIQNFYERAIIQPAESVVGDASTAHTYARSRAAQRVNAMLDQLRSYYNGSETNFLTATSELIQERRRQRQQQKEQQQQQAEAQSSSSSCLQTSALSVDKKNKRLV